MRQKIKLVLDALELGSRGVAGDRGIRRVTHGLVTSLWKHPRIDVIFTGLGCDDARALAAEWLGSCPRQTFVCGDAGKLNCFARWAHRFHRATRMRSNRALFVRLLRRILAPLDSIANKLSGEICAEALQHAEVILSPYRPLPSNICLRSHPAAFLVIYDLIPTFFPELVTEGSIEATRTILASLRPTMWVLCISECVKNDLCGVTGFPPERAFVIPLAASKSVFHPTDDEEGRRTKRRYNLEQTPYILSLSAIEPRKNLEHLVNSFRELVHSSDMGELRLVLVGARYSAHRKIDELVAADDELKRRVLFTGFVPNSDLAGLYSGAIAFAFPSLAEGFGLPVLEAMQCGVPVISSDRTSLPEVVGDAGFLLDPLDRVQWCATMRKLYDDVELREEMSLRSIARAKLFSWEKTADVVVDAFEHALAFSESRTDMTELRTQSAA